jgi:hypothetical protein
VIHEGVTLGFEGHPNRRSLGGIDSGEALLVDRGLQLFEAVVKELLARTFAVNELACPTCQGG